MNLKHYEDWSKTKQNISQNIKNVHFNQKEIFMAYVGYNIGFEQNGDK